MLATENPRQILIVDRDVAAIEPLREKLSDAGFIVRAITDGAAAALAVAEHPPHLVIVDWNIPGFTALDLIQRIRAARPQAIRLIILSGLALNRMWSRGSTSGQMTTLPSRIHCARCSRESVRCCVLILEMRRLRL
jgi:DNA-binding response OmpR family regulator